jgi:23S rRNA G2069 N7-methylase RlmK/C1962 C5-methylase RlmI
VIIDPDIFSKTFQVVIKDPPEFVKRPELEYVKDVGGKVSMPCRAVGTPKPTIIWRRVRPFLLSEEQP